MDINYNNTVFKTEYIGHGKEIIKFYEDKGFYRPSYLIGNEHCRFTYYGLKNNEMKCFVISPDDLKKRNIRIINIDYDIWI